MKMTNQILFIALSLCAGMMIPFQTAMNAQLGKALQSPYFASITVFIVATIGLLLFILASHFLPPTLQQFSHAPKWSFLGGILGGTYILLIVICAPRVGIGNVTVMVLLGQILAAILVDHYGLLHAAQHSLNWKRVIGVSLMICGVYLVKKF